jgi:hypothetical protein
MKICTNPLIPSGANFNYVFDIMSLGSGFKMCVNGKKNSNKMLLSFTKNKIQKHK